MADDVKVIRSVGVAGQGGVGKTSLADALLFGAGAVTRLGRVDDGSSVFDFEPEEIRRKITLTSAIHSLTWKKHDITLVDLPGYANFLPDALTCMRACTGVVFVLAPAKDELRVEAEKMWARSAELQLPVLAFVSRMDRERADFQAAVDDMKKLFGANPVPIQHPIGAADAFRGVVDLITMRALIGQADGSLKEEAVPEDVKAAAEAARERMIEAAAEANDALTEKYLENGTLSNEEVVQALREGTLARRFVPVLYGAAAKAIGMQPLLDASIEYLASASDLGVLSGQDPKIKEPIERRPEADEVFSALVFKTTVDPFAGKLSIFRVLSGKVATDSTVLNVNKDSKERLGHLSKLAGKKQVPVPHAVAGEIVAVAKLKDTATGDTLADEKAPILYPGFTQAPPAISFAVEPKSKGDEEKATQALARMMEEDPSLEMHRDPQTRELILSGVGQLHIEVVIERLKRKYGAEVELKAPKVPYKETIKGRAESQGKLKKQSGGRGQYGDTWLKVEPLPRGTGFEFVDEIVGGVVPRQYIPAVEKGVREALNEGILAGYPIVDVRVTLYDGSYHEVDSSEMAFKIAASMGFKAALAKAKPVILEPIMSMEVIVPDDSMGDVIGDLNSRRGKVLGVDSKPGGQVIRAQVPMSEVLKYSPDLRSMTSGRGSFTVAFSHYEEIPAHLADRVIKEAEAAKAAKA
ncbi:MAG TPA: elongation factor G [Candidatus Margulisiibacteriota bacterium]|nr:elongation factor G [Candidatus Margulisiibacteriota bacterium]